ncbi:MAG TPA: ABC transporter permease [Chitinophagaceae bacterium]|nr:ABC transporter permease [Chitinophagaceae bacterium]
MINKEKDYHIINVNPDSFVEYFRKLIQYRFLILAFAKRDLKVKYAQTFLGVAWSILQPLTGVVIFTFFFSYILGWTSGDLPYSIYVLSGLLGWNFFSYIVNAGSTSVQESSHLIKKIYFPKSILPLSKVVVASVELALSFLLLIPLMLYFGEMITWRIVFLPFVLLFNVLCALTFVFWLSAFAYKKRDLFHLMPFVLYFGIWLTPVFFDYNILPEKLRFLMDYNPMANVVSLWRWMLFDYSSFQWIWVMNFGIILTACLLGMYIYNRRESAFADYV